MRYWRIANCDGKVWLMPRKNTRVAMELYQPSGWRGKVLKAMLPLCSGLPEICTPFPVQEWTLDNSTQDVLRTLFPGKSLEWAVFEGTPSVHQKQVLQVFCGQKILCYCKISANADIINLFEQEADLLHELHVKGIHSIPNCLYAGAIENGGKQLLVLSTEKTVHSHVPHEWGDLLQLFSEDLQAKTFKKIPYEESYLAKGINLLNERIDLLPACLDKSKLVRAMTFMETRYRGKMMDCAVCHGDFTPWNMFIENDRLFVFDWEYAFRCCPIGIDHYHFYTQTAFFEHHWKADELMAFAETRECSWFEVDQLLVYLLLILSRFVGREPEAIIMEDTELLAFWNQLIILCLNKI